MKLVKRCTYDELSMLINKKIHFISDCQLFPDFDIKCKVLSLSYNKNELIFNVVCGNGKKLTIGANMHNLQYEILDKHT